MKKQPWFEEWFDTEYYHLLYKNRDDKEAADFIRKLSAYLNLSETSKVADIACGKGRHSRVLAALGHSVWGYDLSENNINYATKHAGGKEQFRVHDMRLSYPDNDFDAAFNLFTSFGYFDQREEDLEALKNIYNMLKPGGYFVQDYLNGSSVMDRLPEKMHKQTGGCDFNIHKFWKSPFIIKQIQVQSAGGAHNYEEKVKVFSMDELRAMHEQCGFAVLETLGGYQLEPYLEGVSSRLILISQKPL